MRGSTSAKKDEISILHRLRCARPFWTGSTAGSSRHAWQSTATARAAQISRIRMSPSRPSRSTSTPIDTLSTESRLTADRLGTGSSPGSRTTSLAMARIVVVHGATSARRSRGIAASRERTTTGRLPISGTSHHHTSPRAGVWLTTPRQPAETTPNPPKHQVHRAGDGHTLHSWRRSQRRDAGRSRPAALRRRALHRSTRTAAALRRSAAPHRRSCSGVCEPCHKYATPRRPRDTGHPVGQS